MENLKQQESLKKVVIIGGGFAGLNLALRLAKGKSYHITLVDRNNYNYFPPLLYQVATSFLEPSSISYPFRKLFRKGAINFRLGELISVDQSSHTCYLSTSEIEYDYLVFATGAHTNYFGIENIKKYAIPMKTVDDALNMRNTLLKTMEQATITQDKVEREKLMTIVVAGGGPTGVEVAGMLAELKKYVLAKDYPELRDTPGAIYIIDGSPTLLTPMSEKTHKNSFDALTGLNVIIKLNTRVLDFDGSSIILSGGQIIEAKSLIWAAGVIAVVPEGIPATSVGHGRRMMVDGHNKVIGIEDIYAIGDVCIQQSDKDFPKGHPQLAQVAIQQGQNLAHNFLAMAKGKPLKTFKYFDKGTMAIVGRNYAVVDLAKPKFHIKGFPALFIWLFIHVMSLLNHRNKAITLYNWAVAYITKDQSLRMIFRG